MNYAILINFVNFFFSLMSQNFHLPNIVRKGKKWNLADYTYENSFCFLLSIKRKFNLMKNEMHIFI